MPTFENGKNYSIRFEISNNSPIFDLIRFEMKKHYSHITISDLYHIIALLSVSFGVTPNTGCILFQNLDRSRFVR